MDGLLVIDKPVGPTSHDIVARVRRALREPQIGHTGTLDPMASGVLALVLGRATRLARFLSASDKRYLATVRLGVSTDTYDAVGRPSREPHPGPFPPIDAINRALDAFRGTFVQQPPAFSAKKIDGRRSYQLARARARPPHAILSAWTGPPAPLDVPALPAPVCVTTERIEIVSVARDLVTLSVVCSAGFYVRALAHDLGEALGVGAHLAALSRTETSGVTLDAAVSMAEIDAATSGLERARAAVIPLERMLPLLPRINLTHEGADRVAKGRDLGPQHASGSFPSTPDPEASFQLLDSLGRLIGIAQRSATPGLLHPVVVLV